MTEGAAGRRRNRPPAVRSVLAPSSSTSPTTGASAGSLRRGGRSHRRVGELEPVVPPTASEGRPDETGLSMTRGRLSRWVPHDGPPAGPLGLGQLLTGSSSPHSYRAWLSVAAATMILPCRGEATTRTTSTCHCNPPSRWPHRLSTTAPMMDLRYRRPCAPPPSAS
jgi:hypothetical protein